VLHVYLSGTSRSFAEGRSEKESTLRTETGGSKPNSQRALLEINNMLNQGICQRASSSAADPAVSELSHMVNFDCLGKTMCECLIRHLFEGSLATLGWPPRLRLCRVLPSCNRPVGCCF